MLWTWGGIAGWTIGDDTHIAPVEILSATSPLDLSCPKEITIHNTEHRTKNTELRIQNTEEEIQNTEDNCQAALQWTCLVPVRSSLQVLLLQHHGYRLPSLQSLLSDHEDQVVYIPQKEEEEKKELLLLLVDHIEHHWGAASF